MDFLRDHVEALIFCSKTPASVEEIQKCLTEVLDSSITESQILASIQQLEEKYQSLPFSFQLYHRGGGYQLLTKPAYQNSVGIFLKQMSKRRLSTAALETLSIIAYKQPTTRGDIEDIRGVNADYTIHKLMDKGLIEVKGKSETIGRPTLYGVSKKFMEYFGINSLDELPTPKNFSHETQTIGDPVEAE